MSIQNTTISDSKKKLFWGIRILLSFLFLLSAVAKLYPSPFFALTTFEMKQLVPMGFDPAVAGYLSRTLIGGEFALGILLLLPYYFKRLILPASFLLLLLFNIELLYEMINAGNSGSCGCFGELIPMTPLEAFIKNIIAMALIVYLYVQLKKENDNMNFAMVSTTVLGAVLFVYLIGPMKQATTEVVEEDVTEALVIPDNDQVTSDSLIVNTDQNPVAQGPEKIKPEVKDEPKKKKSGFSSIYPDIDNGRKILCFFAPGCEHCQATIKDLTQMKKQMPDFPDLKIVFIDEETDLIPDFFTNAGEKYTYKILDVAKFWQTIGLSRDTPGVFYLWNGNIIKVYDGINENAFKVKEFKTLIGKKYSELKL